MGNDWDRGSRSKPEAQMYTKGKPVNAGGPKATTNSTRLTDTQCDRHGYWSRRRTLAHVSNHTDTNAPFPRVHRDFCMQPGC